MRCLKFLLFLFSFISIERFCHHQTEGFQLHKITSNLPFNVAFATAPPAEEIKELLSQPYRFLGSGGQSYAFLSEDKRAVIKFFKHHHMRPLPLSIQQQSRKNRLKEIFTSFTIAHDFLKEETGLLFLHLNQGTDFQMKLTLIDSIGISHQIDLDKTTFALQKRARLALPTLQALLKKKKIEEAKSHLCSLLDLMVKRINAQISNCDPIVKRNTGFIDGQAVEIDLGCFAKEESLSKSLAKRRAFFFDTLKLRYWVKKRAPNLLTFFDLQFNQRFAILSQDHSFSIASDERSLMDNKNHG